MRLAILRGRNEEILMVALKYQPDETPITEQSEFEQQIAKHFNIFNVLERNKWLRDTVRLTWKAKIFLSLELEAFAKLKEQADTDAITVFVQKFERLAAGCTCWSAADFGA